MAKGKNQKVKLIKILEILRAESDENHPMSTNALIKRLRDEDVDVERKTLYDDIACLNECGYEIMTIKTNTNNYYIEDRTFDVAELKILLDAIGAAQFITEKKTNVLSDKIAVLGGSHRAKLLRRHVVTLEPKHTNEKIYYIVDSLNDCIERGKKASFKYYKYDISGKRIHTHDGDEYVVSPLSLVFSDDNYYLVAYTDKHDDLINFRVDRIDCVTVLEDAVDERAKKKSLSSKDSHKIFSMFKGEDCKVTLLCDNSLVNVIVDKFGENVVMTKHTDGDFTVSASVQLAPTFYAWVFTFGEKMKIISPKKVVEEMKGLAAAVSNQY